MAARVYAENLRVFHTMGDAINDKLYLSRYNNKQIWIVYETINLITGKLYRGIHKCKNSAILDPWYIGGGISRDGKRGFLVSVKKHGRRNFKRRILEIVYNQVHANILEMIYVDEVWVRRKDTYNLVCGGGGMFGWEPTQEFRDKVSAGVKRFYDNGGISPLKGTTQSAEHRKNTSIAMKGKKRPPKSDEHKENIRKAINKKYDDGWVGGVKKIDVDLTQLKIDRNSGMTYKKLCKKHNLKISTLNRRLKEIRINENRK